MTQAKNRSTRKRRLEGADRAAGQTIARITATEMVGVHFTTHEVRRLLDAIGEGKLGAPAAPENIALRRKFEVLLQVATATEKRRGALQAK